MTDAWHRFGRKIGVGIYFCVFLIGLVVMATRAPERRGDGFEYLLMVEAFNNHGTPDLRAGDVASLLPQLESSDIRPRANMDSGFFEARGGRRVSWHFWIYSLLATPVASALDLVGANPLAGLQVFNVLCFGLAVGVVLFCGRQTARERWLYLGLVCVGPVWWYLPWTHPEVMSWSAVVIAVVFCRARRYPWAAFAAAVGAMHQPPLLLLALGIVVLSLAQGNRRSAFLTAVAAVPAGLPVLFSLWAFGTPSVIAARGAAGLHFASLERVHSLFFDLNQGMLPHTPWLLALWLATAIVVALRRDLRGLFILAIPVAMCCVAATTGNWNAGSAGMMRYALWMGPVMAWLVVDHLPKFRNRDLMLSFAVAASLPIVLAGGSKPKHMSHGPAASWVLTHAPELYSPVAEIFVERTLHRGAGGGQRLRTNVPVFFSNEQGVVTKFAYLPPARMSQLSRFVVEPGYLERLMLAPSSAGTIVYEEPPPGAMILRGSPAHLDSQSTGP